MLPKLEPNVIRPKPSISAETGPCSSSHPARSAPVGHSAAWLPLLSFALTLLMFWPAALGQKILAPLDIPANLFPKFHYVDPTATGVPANHYVIDLILGDISRNLLVYEAWSRGEMPWWDPYTDTGRPLAAEAHAVNVSDPWKVILFHLLPFELAYNWTRLIPFIVSGIAAFSLLRHFGFGLAPCVWGAVLYQFAGCNFMMFSGPTVQASFAYYPLLWLLWERGVMSARLSSFIGSSLVSALVFLSGNLQSHSYLLLFAIAFALGYGWGKRARWRLVLVGTACSVGLGLLLAAPFILSQVEMFLLSIRPLRAAVRPVELLSGLVSLSASFFPWVLGTFRTLDLSKVLGQGALGFWIYIGSAATIVALLGALTRSPAGSRIADVKRTALALLIVYLGVCSTPLLRLLYTRTAWLAVLGLIMLFAIGWERLAHSTLPARKWGLTLLGIASALVLVMNIGGLIIFPHFQSQIEARVLAKDQSNPTLDQAPTLRKFQVQNLPNEITFKNPETLLAFASLVAIGLMLTRSVNRRGVWLHAALITSTAPLLLLGHRYVPMHPIALWNQIRAGGPEQHRVIAAFDSQRLRLFEKAPGAHEFVFPGALSQLFGVHTSSGHTSLILRHAGLANKDGEVPREAYDFKYFSAARGLKQGELLKREGGSPARFHWVIPSERHVTITSETLCTVTLDLQPGPAADLIRTDTYYPGWRVTFPRGTALRFEPPCFARIHVPENVTRLQLHYEPRWLRTGIWIAAAALLVITVYFVVSMKNHRQCAGAMPK